MVKQKIDLLTFVLVALLMISFSCAADTYWWPEKPGKKDDAEVKAISWQCNKVVFDPLSKAIDVIPVPGAGGVKLATKAAIKAGQKCVTVAVEQSEGLALHVTWECVCDLEVSWNCKVNEVQYEKGWIWDSRTGKSQVGYYTYNEDTRKQQFTECKKDEECKEVCAKVEKNWLYEFGGKPKRVQKGKKRTVIVGAWHNQPCTE